MVNYKIILFYKYIAIDNPVVLRDEQRRICEKLGLKGRVIVATEGINATLEGLEKDTKEYQRFMIQDSGFRDIQFKISDGTGTAFPKLSVKVRSEIVAGRLGDENIKPWQMTGKYLQPEELHQWINSKKEFYIIDMRNDFEYEVGHFDNSIFSGMATFADLPKVLPKIKHLKRKTILTVCTGGVRCEKASGFLVSHKFEDVYQLYGGIVSYMEKYPNQDFAGALYVFDGRLVMGFNLEDPNRRIIGRCKKCGQSSEHFINCEDPFCHRHFIQCENCCEVSMKCPMGCRDYSKEHPEAQLSVV